MFYNKGDLARKALSIALNVRASNNIELWDPLCIYDLVEKVGVELFFLSIPSMEGMYTDKDKPTILLSSLRPPVRQAFTCAHELGHHYFRHTFKVDEKNYFESIDDSQEEFLAQAFAGFLLMPKIAIEHAFKKRGIKYGTGASTEYFSVANNFGVGYSTLINHMYWSLKMISQRKAQELLKLSRKQVRQIILNIESDSDLYVVNEFWNGRPIDICKEDIIMINKEARFEGKSVEVFKEDRTYSYYKATTVGIGRFIIEGIWSSFVRVSRKEYVGRNIYRHLEE